MAEQLCKRESRFRETSEEKQFRLEQLRGEMRLRRYKDMILFTVGLAVSIFVGALCIWVILSPTSPPNAVNWATATITSMASGISGYLTGKSINRH
jgi:hypothetical protein